ncbi:unnamed protein product [Staurois parvus]|uniref:Uncharacterized protein n=1 Tax=Staurois parvus TaxID=386267 RepID=A0ABN9GF59_9NEOB|nr:unnamed protein product [Staurois parvus]
MHSPKKNPQKNLSSNTHQTEHVQNDSTRYVFNRRRRIREVRLKQRFYTIQRINPLGSTVSITSMLYCIYRLVLRLWV